MNKLTRKILEIIINHMLKHQNEWTDLFIEDINNNYHSMIGQYHQDGQDGQDDQDDQDGTKVMLCGWYYFTVKKDKVTFHIAKCS